MIKEGSVSVFNTAPKALEDDVFKALDNQYIKDLDINHIKIISTKAYVLPTNIKYKAQEGSL
jgi:hypothetical protein